MKDLTKWLLIGILGLSATGCKSALDGMDRLTVGKFNDTAGEALRDATDTVLHGLVDAATTTIKIPQ